MIKKTILLLLCTLSYANEHNVQGFNKALQCRYFLTAQLFINRIQDTGLKQELQQKLQGAQQLNHCHDATERPVSPALSNASTISTPRSSSTRPLEHELQEYIAHHPLDVAAALAKKDIAFCKNILAYEHKPQFGIGTQKRFLLPYLIYRYPQYNEKDILFIIDGKLPQHYIHDNSFLETLVKANKLELITALYNAWLRETEYETSEKIKLDIRITKLHALLEVAEKNNQQVIIETYKPLLQHCELRYNVYSPTVMHRPLSPRTWQPEKPSLWSSLSSYWPIGLGMTCIIAAVVSIIHATQSQKK